MRPIDGDRLIDSLESAKRCRGVGVHLVYSLIQEGVRQLPTITVDDLRPKGRWNPLPEDDREQMVGDQCSLCGYEHFGSRFNFCPSCGAKMVSGEADG